MLSIVSSLYFFPRVFGDAETKAMYKIESILKSYVNTKATPHKVHKLEIKHD